MYVIVNANHEIWGFNEAYESYDAASRELVNFWGPPLNKRLRFKIMEFDEYKSTLNASELKSVLSRVMSMAR